MSCTITVEEFRNFFKYYKGEEHQINAVDELYQELVDCKFPHLSARSSWMQTYRTPIEGEKSVEKISWPITKEQMAAIMGGSPATISDQVMDDYARCVDTFKMDRLAQVYFLGQCGHESAGLRYPLEIHDGSNYEGRKDLGNIYPGDGVKYAGTGYIQVTGRYNHQAFSDYLDSIGKPDYKVMEVGKTYTCDQYPWTISGFWWHQNNMNAYCANRTKVTNFEIDEVGARVNGRNRPNGADDRIAYTDKAYRTIL